MRSKNESELDGLPEPTPEDIAALERVDRRTMTDSEYFRFLEKLTEGLVPRERRNPDEPFEL